MHVFALPTDSSDLLQQAVFMVEELEQDYPAFAARLADIDIALRAIALLPKATTSDCDVVIGAMVQVIISMQCLPFATEELQAVLRRYLRIMEVKQAREQSCV